MSEHLADIHWLGVVVATVVFAALGGVYFGVLVPKQYAYAIGREDRPAEKAAGALFYAGPLLCILVNVIADALFISALGITTLGAAAVFGLVVGIGFLAPMVFNIAINPLFPRPLTYGLLNTPYFLVGNVLASILLVVIPWWRERRHMSGQPQPIDVDDEARVAFWIVSGGMLSRARCAIQNPFYGTR